MSATHLLDVNVLVALLWPTHVQYAQARQWLRSRGGRPWATTPATQLGAVRVLAQLDASPSRLATRSGLAGLLALIAHGEHVFLPATLDVRDPLFDSIAAHLQGPGQLTDYYLLSLAAHHGATLATFDRRMSAAIPADHPLLAHLEVVPS